MRLSLGSCSLEHNVLAFILAMHQGAPLRSYQITKENSSKNAFVQKPVPTHSKCIVKYHLMWYLTLLLSNDRIGNSKITKSSVSAEYVRQAHANVSTSDMNMDHMPL